VVVVWLPPPPQAGIKIISMTSPSKNCARRWRRLPISITPKNIKPPTATQCLKDGRKDGCSVAVAAVVVTVIVEVLVAIVPDAAIVAGENWQAAPVGRPEQARMIVPVKPVEFETDIELCPEPPGAETITVDAAVGMTAKNPAVIVNVWDAAEALALKLASPL
jgi:hypothetical protein